MSSFSVISFSSLRRSYLFVREIVRDLFTKKSTLARDKALKASENSWSSYHHHGALFKIILEYGVVGIATRYGLKGPGLEPRWVRHFPDLSRLASRPAQPPVKWVPGRFRV